MSAHEENNIPTQLAQHHGIVTSGDALAPASVSSVKAPLISVLSSDGDSGRAVDADAEDAATAAGFVAAPETIKCVLEILAAVLTFGAARKTDREEKVLRRLLPLLQQIAFHDSDAEVADDAHDVALMLLNREVQLNDNRAARGGGQLEQRTEALRAGSSAHSVDELLKELQSSDLLFSGSPVMRAYGARTASQWIRTSLNRGVQVLYSCSFEHIKPNHFCNIIMSWLVRHEFFKW